MLPWKWCRKKNILQERKHGSIVPVVSKQSHHQSTGPTQNSDPLAKKADMQHRGDYSDTDNLTKEEMNNRDRKSNAGNSTGIQPVAPEPCTGAVVIRLYGLPKRSGKLKDLSKFDATFFGVDPNTVKGSRTGVFIGASTSESHEAWSTDPESTVGYGMTGCTRSMFANRLSFFFDFKGPSYAVDTACSSSLLALDHALYSIRSGLCDAAVVGGSNLCLKPAMAVQFMKLGMLSPDGMCKSFDAKGNGYCRAEGIVALYLQQESVARRIYCTLLHTKTNSDGNKVEGSEVGVNPAQVAYVEAHGTGTKAGDPQEVNTICDVFCNGRIGALPIGSVKSNMGHAEPASGLAAVAKVIVAMEEGLIPGNLHYHEPNPEIPGLMNGHLKVVDKATPWNGGTVGVNSFGFGGSNVHAILRSNETPVLPEKGCKKKRLFVYAGRSENGLKETLSKVQKHETNLHLHKLMHETAHMSANSHPYRGFTVLNDSDVAHVQRVTTESRPVWFVFSGMGTQWHGMGKKMMDDGVFKESILRSDGVLQPYGVKLYDLLMNGDDTTFENTVNSFVGIAAIQVAQVDMLRKMGVSPDGIVGHSVGELGCAYADGGLTAAETVLAAYWRGRCIQEANLPSGAMAAVGLTWIEARQQCPEGVVPACHNSRDTVTVSGPLEAVRAFVQQLKERDIFAKEVNTAGVAFHSYYMKNVASSLKTALDEVIPAPRPRTSRWISSSIPRHLWSSELAMKCSAEYHVNNLVSPVLFQEALQCVPDNAVVIEIAPHCLLQPILKRSLSDECCIVGLMKRGHEDNMMFCLSNLGKCYQHGLKLNPLGLATDVSYPVPRGTPMISPLVSWDHSLSWNVPTADMFAGCGASTPCGCVLDIDVSSDSEDHYMIDHKIDGRVLYPATGYLVLIWKLLAKSECRMYDEMSVEFRDVTFHRATFLQQNGKLQFEVSLMKGTGAFEILEGGSVVCTGNVIQGPQFTSLFNTPEIKSRLELSQVDIYKEFRLRGYEYGPAFQGIVATDLKGQYAYMLVKTCYI
ncbi:FAS-like protein [Mya arenaria]|uniref:Fatty acid synthase n=1 Tax=Mya arenaria TaxID=6604 RepID=A0ABY7FC02_MYAAR|nr:FAS-like protein [Mya arenaria]